MAGIWIDDDRRECEYCGELVARLFTVDDSDYSVGYHGDMEVCEECLRRYELKKGRRA